MGLTGLWLPDSARPEPQKVYRCEVPGCGRRFPDTQRQQFHRHVRACAKRHEGEIQELVAGRKDAFTAPSDEEQWRWVREKAAEHGPDRANQMLRRGSRKKAS